MHPGNQEEVQNPTFPRLEGCGRGLLRWEGPERHPGSLREDDGGGGANELKAVLSGAGGRGSRRGGGRGAPAFSHLTTRVARWSKCASARFSCPCF